MSENATQQLTPKRPTPVKRALETLVGVGVAAGQTRPATLVDVINQRAFRAHADALREYVALRVGDLERARTAFLELRAKIATADAEALVTPPGVRAQLFAIARHVALRAREDVEADVSKLRGNLPYALGGSVDTPTPQLRALRTELPENEAEILELRHRRDLTDEEIACIVDRPLDQVERAIEVAEQHVRTLFGDRDPSRALREGFALVLGVEPPPGTSDELATLPPGTIIGERYRIEKHVGSGAFGAVYRASDLEVPGHELALKLLHQTARDDEARTASMRELRNIAAVFHPSIVQFKDLGWYEGRLWFVMPWYEGETLETRMRRAPLSRSQAHRIFQPLARALASMHAALFATRPRTEPLSHKADVFSLALAMRNALEPATEEDVDGGGVDRFIERRAEIMPSPPTARDLRYLTPYFAKTLSLSPADRPSATELAVSLDVLLAPERRRARIRSVLAIVVPLLVIAVLATGWVYSTLTRQVKVQRAVAVREAERASNLEADLTASERARLGITNESERISGLLARGQASNSELSSRLSAAQRSLTDASDRMAVFEKRIRILMEELTEVRAREATLRQQLADTTTRLDAEHTRAVNAEQRAQSTATELERTRASLASTQASLVSASDRANALTVDLGHAQADLASARAEVQTARADRARLESLLANATAEASRAGSARDDAVREAEQLRRRVRELEARGTQPPAPVQPAP